MKAFNFFISQAIGAGIVCLWIGASVPVLVYGVLCCLVAIGIEVIK